MKVHVRQLWKLCKKTAFNNLLIIKYHIDNDLIIGRENVKATRLMFYSETCTIEPFISMYILSTAHLTHTFN